MPRSFVQPFLILICPGLQSAFQSRYNIVPNAHEFAGESEIRDLEPLVALLNLRHGIMESLIHASIHNPIGERGTRRLAP